MIGRVPQQDQILYQTERYDTATFGYDIPVYDDGWYLLVLKFSEVYFNAPNMKVIQSVSLEDLVGSLKVLWVYFLCVYWKENSKHPGKNSSRHNL